MRNKLRRVKTVKDSRHQRKDQAQTARVIVLSESSCSEDEILLDAKDKNGSNSAPGLSEIHIQRVQETKKTLCAKGAKIAPIFLQHRKRSSDGELGQRLRRMQKSELPPQSDNAQPVKSPPSVSQVTVKDRCSGQLSPSTLHSCLEEIQTSNPAFPVRAVINSLQKKTSEGLQEHALTEKRKRITELSQSVPKRLRSSLPAESAAGMGHLSDQGVLGSSVHPVEEQPRCSKLSRTHRLKQRSGSQAGLNEPNILKSSDTVQRDFCFEDTLWTDKYSPQRSGEVIGNPASVNKLYSWLRKWKLRADCDKRRKMEEKKQEENSNDSWDCGDFQGEAGSDDGREKPLGNAMLITGPSGVGKTASVYACAQELGFKVFEVNCSSQRSGRHVLSQLREVTQSHLVDTMGKDPLKPAYFSSFSTSICSSKSGILPGKMVLPKNVTSASKRRTVQKLSCSRHRAKAKPATVTLTHYFKMKAKADHLQSGGLPPFEKPEDKKPVKSSTSSDETVPHDKKTATSLILFEEVDVIFDDDIGFLAAIKAFMSITKRPVILTTNDPLFKDRFDSSLDEIIFKIPSAVNICSYLQLVCLAEGVRLDLDDVRSLHRLTCGDVRRCLLQLQIWVQSGGRWPSQCGCLHKKPLCVQDSNAAEGGEHLSSLLPYKTGCSANMLGLHGVTPDYLLNLLKSWSKTHMNELLILLAESWRRGVPLLYFNLEFLLSVAAQDTSVHCLEMVACSSLQRQPSDAALHIQQQNRSISARASLTYSKSVSNMSRLSRRKYNTTSSDSLTLRKTSFLFSVTPLRDSNSSSKAQQIGAKEESECLDALTDFFDLISYLDANLLPAGTRVSDSCTPEAFVWTGAEIKDGLLDEMREEEVSSWSQERLLDILAAVEGLGCHRCLCRMSEVWTEVQKLRQALEDQRWGRLVERLALTSSKRHNLSFSFQPLCEPSGSQRRYRLSRTVLSSKPFRLLGNRRAVCVDYMPVLRAICRSHKAQQQKQEPLGCMNYLNSTHLGLSKSAMQLLAEDFT
ncbi:ATPase family AAA domain-containing protein 5b [Archocentrus centrarchus]|uniref:ATPase family AAA domain-containing protein 5b n=1 Tax=Archocentrus centrarchus TaxID=63155 RepID=UPI0011EA3821|nr:ATPase family AAA domain-containing protein 5-like [Archocentrus centrarchus]